MASIGYLVITLPPEVRDRYRTKEALGKLGTAFKRMLQRHGFTRGLRRWHWFGENGGAYHPHLNVLTDGSWLPPEDLGTIRESVGRILEVNIARVNVRYEYREGVPRMLHLVKYVLRSTFLDWRWDPELAAELLGFRNSSAWGSWRGDPVWEIPRAEEQGVARGMVMLECGYCPHDGSRIVWNEIIPARRLAAPWWEHVGAGYWTRGPTRAP
jgi:hypothetical protein